MNRRTQDFGEVRRNFRSKVGQAYRNEVRSGSEANIESFASGHSCKYTTMRTKTCAWGTCNSDSRYSDRPHMAGVTFRPFPKPKTKLDKCKEWIKLCNRPHEDLNVDKIKSYTYVCSKHFKDDTSEYPEPAGCATPVRKRKAPAERDGPTKQRRKKATPESSPVPQGYSSEYSTLRDILTSPKLCTTKAVPVSATAKPPLSTVIDNPAITNSNVMSLASTPSSSSCTMIANPSTVNSNTVMSLSSSQEMPLKGFSSAVISDESENIPNFTAMMRSPLPKEKYKCHFEESDPPQSPAHKGIPLFSKLLTPPKSNNISCNTNQEKSSQHDQILSCVPDLDSLFQSPRKYSASEDFHIFCTKCKSHIELSEKDVKRLFRNRFINKVLANDPTCFYFTGIPCTELFNVIFDWFAPYLGNLTQKRRKKKILEHRTEFMMTLVKIRRGFDNQFLAFLFGISPANVGLIFNQWVDFLDKCFASTMRWPSKEICRENLPDAFKEFPNTRAIIDCTEYTIDRPYMPSAQKVTYSNYKHRNTLKQLIAIMPSGAITFASKLYGGSISDAAIVEMSDFLDLIENNDDIMADRGFNIRHLLLKRKATLNMPAFSRGKTLSLKAITRSRKIASVRIHVERAIRRMKTFRILSGLISLKTRFYLNQITRIVIFLCNLQKRLVD